VLASGVGFFISYNSAGKGQISPRSAVWEQFLDRYYPYKIPETAPPSTAAEDARAVSGSYLVSRRPVTNILSFISAIGVPDVTVNADGTISMGSRDLNGQPKHFREVAPLVFRDVNGQERVAFKKDASGRMVGGVDFPFMVFEKASWYDSSMFNNILIFGSLGIFVLTVVLWPVAALARSHYGFPLKLAPGGRRRRFLVHLVCLVDVAFALAWIGVLSSLSDLVKLNDGLDTLLRVVQIVGWIGVIGTLVALYDGWLALSDSNRWWWNRIHAIGIALASVGFSWFVYHWHMLHFSLKF